MANDASAYRFAKLTGDDLQPMRQLLKVFGEAFNERETYQSRQPDDAYLASLLGAQHFIAVAAFDGDAVIGGLAAYVLDKFEQARSEIYIYDLAVSETYRRRGIATVLIEYLRSLAQTRGCYVIFVQADLEDEPAIALYQALGTQETAHHFDIEVKRRRD